MAEYIERGAALREAKYAAVRGLDPVAFVEDVPVADVAPVVYGRWERYSHSRYYGVDDFGDPIYKDGVVYYCSKCRRKTVIK